jgi:hypothetical protein
MQKSRSIRGTWSQWRDQQTGGVDLGGQVEQYCILGWDWEKLTEGESRTTREDFEGFFRSLAGAYGDGIK